MLNVLYMPQEFYADNLYRLYWQNPMDTQKQILIIEVMSKWTWDDAYQVINHVNTLLDEVEGRCYSVFYLQDTAQKALNDSFAFAHVEQLIRTDPFKEEQVYFVGKIKAVRNAVFVVERVLQLFNRTTKITFANTIQDALEEIDDHEKRLVQAAN